MTPRNYLPDEPVFPDPSDDDLWISVSSALLAEYGARALPEHLRWAFEAVCSELQDYLPYKDFFRKVRLKWLWKRPPLPRGIVDF